MVSLLLFPINHFVSSIVTAFEQVDLRVSRTCATNITLAPIGASRFLQIVARSQDALLYLEVVII